MKKTHSIRSKIVLLAVIPMLLISTVLLAYAFIGGVKNITSALESSISETANISAQAITNKLGIYETAVNEAASNDIFRNEGFDPDEALSYLEEVRERNGFLRIGYTDENGINQLGSNFSERQYFIDCREKLAPVTSDPYASKDGNGALSVLFCAPIVRNGEFCGIVYGAGDAKLLTNIISDVLVGEEGRNFIIDSTGTFIAHNDFTYASSLRNFVTEARSDTSLSRYAEVISEIADISASSEEQSSCIDSVSEKMDVISSVVKSTAASADKSSEISEKLKNEAKILKQLVGKFTLS